MINHLHLLAADGFGGLAMEQEQFLGGPASPPHIPRSIYIEGIDLPGQKTLDTPVS